jgi:uncharacterized Zn-binding protein involved in type VI secretion
MIGNKPAWRGMPLAAAAGVMSAKTGSDTAVTTTVTASVSAAGTPGAPAAVAAETTAKTTATTSMTSALTGAGAGADQHMCATPFPPTVPAPHSLGMVITGSMTVLINNLPACRQGDTILECLGPPNTISMGFPTVIIGDSMYVGQGGALAAAAQTGAPFCEH